MLLGGGPVHLSPRWGLGWSVWCFYTPVAPLVLEYTCRPAPIRSGFKAIGAWRVAVIRAAPFLLHPHIYSNPKNFGNLKKFHSKARGNVRTHRR